MFRRGERTQPSLLDLYFRTMKCGEFTVLPSGLPVQKTVLYFCPPEFCLGLLQPGTDQWELQGWKQALRPLTWMMVGRASIHFRMLSRNVKLHHNQLWHLKAQSQATAEGYSLLSSATVALPRSGVSRLLSPTFTVTSTSLGSTEAHFSPTQKSVPELHRVFHSATAELPP